MARRLPRTNKSRLKAGMTLLCLTLFFPLSIHAACTLKDDAGHSFTFTQPIKRIISLAPDITENLFAIDAGGALVGVIKGSDFPLAAKKIPEVGSFTGLDLERIISLHPDLIITWGNSFSRQLNPLRKIGIPIYINDPHHLEDVAHTFKQFGCLTGNVQAARRAADQYKTQLNALREEYKTTKKRRVFYQIGSFSLFTINKNNWISEAISLCGGNNIFGELKLSAPEITWEAVIAANPEIIISDVNGDTWKQKWQNWPPLLAVKNHALYSVDADIISRASGRLLQGVKQMCAQINPTSFKVEAVLEKA